MNETLPSAGVAGNARYLALSVLLVVTVALTVAGWLATERSEAENRAALAAELGRVARSLPELAQEAAHGADGAIARLQAASERLGRLAAAQDRGDVDGPAKAQVLGIDVDRRVVYACAAVSVLLLVLLLQQQVGDARRRAREIEHRNVDTERRKEQTDDQNRRNQDAILRLLDEMGGLAEGDLTVQASVTEDITGAIADSINYAIEALRELVTTINATSERVAAAVVETRAVADRLAEAAQAQARQIEASNTTVAQMAQALDAVSGKTSTSAEVARQSADLAREGGERVRRTMHGMDAIREHIQETSKRIKRLGESSQEIGDIVELINDIADQTNILALNAAIQASAAGEAGRGFAVVADEVQRLAERSGHATRRIEALVKTIQADTNEAIISMEKSTTEVVSGAGLAEKAGEALGEIESVAARLAALIAEISTAAAEVSTMAGRVAVSMEAINATTAETAAGGATTARAMGELSALAQDLRQSVAGFRLPGAGAA